MLIKRATKRRLFKKFAFVSAILMVFNMSFSGVFLFSHSASANMGGIPSYEEECLDAGFDFAVAQWICDQNNCGSGLWTNTVEIIPGTSVIGDCETANWEVGSSGAAGIVVRAGSDQKQVIFGQNGVINKIQNSFSHVTFCGKNTAPVCGNGKMEGEEQCDDGNNDDFDGCTNNCTVGECVLELTKTADVAEVNPGERIIYTLTLTNGGTAKCTGGGVKLYDEYDSQTFFAGATTTPSYEEPGSRLVMWNFGTMLPGKSEQIEMTVNVAIEAVCQSTIVNSAHFWSDQTGHGSPVVAETKVVCQTPEPFCGDGVKNGQEECDDGNSDNGDSCKNDCTLPISAPICGDGIVNQSSEQCDEGANNGTVCAPGYGGSCNYCSNSCQNTTITGPYCGDGVKNGQEECDDGNSDNGDSCKNDCTLPCSGPKYGSVKVCKYEDMDGDLGTTGDQNPLNNWLFTLGGLATTSAKTTGQDGCAIFADLLAGDYNISETLPAGWLAMSPLNGQASTTVAINQRSEVNFYNLQHGSVSGYKYGDADGLASTTDDRTGLEGWVINLFDSISTTTPIATTTTNSSGYYEFLNILPGQYTLSENMPSGWTQLSAPSALSLMSGQRSRGNNFVNHLAPKAPFCGDGIMNGQEACDNGIANGQKCGPAGYGESCNYCSNTCQTITLKGPYCGDGVINGSNEQCDSEEVNCTNDCKYATQGGGGSAVNIAVLGETGEPVLTIDKTVNMQFANPGDEVEYTVLLKNTGNLTAFDVVLSDILPAGFKYADDNKTTRSWNIGNINPGENKTTVYKAVVGENVASGIYANIAEAIASNHDKISDITNIEVRAVEILGEEFAGTGFDLGEMLLLIGMVILAGGMAFGMRRMHKEG